MRGRRSGNFGNFAAGGCAGCCSCCSISVGIFFLIPGIVFLALSTSDHFSNESEKSFGSVAGYGFLTNSKSNDNPFDDVEEDMKSVFRIAGIVCVSISSLLLIIGIALCIFVCCIMSKPTTTSTNAQSGPIYQSNMVYGPNPGNQAIPHGNPQGHFQPTLYSNSGYNASIPPEDQMKPPNYINVSPNSYI